METLVVTGTLAHRIVRKYVEESDVEAEVVSLPIQVAALMPINYISNMLQSRDLSKFKLILVPGLVAGDVSQIAKQLGIPTYKGPKQAANLPLVLQQLGKARLSTTRPACELLQDLLKKEAFKQLDLLQKKTRRLAEKKSGIRIGEEEKAIWIGTAFPPRVLAEIVDASALSRSELRKKARDFVESGAEIIDIGMVAGGGNPSKAKLAVKIVRKTVSTPVSIDTSDAEEIRAAVEAGVDLILSINAENMKDVSEFACEIPVVATPADETRNCPTYVDEKIEQLEKNLKRARQLGFKKLIADPILVPIFTPNLTESLVAYYRFRQRNPSIPIMFGAGNVTELMDADSIGANLLLASIAYDLNANIILTTEASDKTLGCVRELSTGIKMAMLARERSSPPKDLGLDLLVIKEKRRREDDYKRAIWKYAREIPVKRREFVYDPRGCFKVIVDRDRRCIVVSHYKYNLEKPDVVIRGKEPLEMCATLIESGLLSRFDHAAYLGIELTKAEIALQTGKSYVQDSALLF